MRQSSKRLTSSFFALGLILAAFVVFFSLVKPAYADLQRLRGELVSRTAFVENQRAVIEQVKNLIAAYQGGAEIHEAVALALPDNADVATAIGQLNGLLSTNGLSPQSFTASLEVPPALTDPLRPKTALSAQPIGAITFKVRFAGSYAEFKRFLGNLETNIRIMDLTALTFQPADKTNRDLYTFDATISTYYQAQSSRR